MIYCGGVPGLISPTAPVRDMAAAAGNGRCQKLTEPALLIAGAVCSAMTDSGCLCALTSPRSGVLWVCCSVRHGGK